METNFVSDRRAIAAVVLLLAACGGEEPVVTIDDFHDRSPLVACTALEGPEPAPVAVTQLAAASAASLLLIDEPGRTVLLLDADGRRMSALEFAEEGPRSVGQLVDAAMSGDSLVVIADAGRNRLQGFTIRGEERWTQDLSFPPQRVAFAGDRLLVAALGMDPRIAALVFERRDGDLASLSVPFATHPDMIGRMFVNSVALLGYADGRAIVAHQFVLPRAWQLGSDGAAVRAALPVPDGAASALGFVPPMPMREGDLERMAVPVIAAAPDPASGGVLYLTRTGMRSGAFLEKAVIRVDRELAYVSSIRLPVNAVAMTYLAARPESVLVVDVDQAWYRCAAPPARADA